MHVTLLTVGSRRDIQPFLAFGLGLQDAGHRVRVCTHPRFRALVEGQALEFAPLAQGAVARRGETEEGRRWAEHWSRWMPAWVGLLQDARSVARRRLRDADAGCDGAEVIVASNLTQLLGWQLARDLDLPLVRALLNAPSYWMARRSRPPVARALRQLAWLGARPWLNRVRRDALGRPPLPLHEPIGTLEAAGELVLCACSPAVFPRPEGWGAATEVTGYWFLDREVDPEPSDASRVPGRRTSARLRRVRHPDRSQPPGDDGHDSGGAAAHWAAGRGAATAREPGGCRARRRHAGRRRRGARLAVPAVRGGRPPRCAGTTATALRAGVPAVIVPHNSDQFSWGRRMAELGVNPPPIPRRRLSVDRLEHAVIAATRDRELRERTEALAGRIRAEDGVTRAVEAFECRVAGGSDPRGGQGVTRHQTIASGRESGAPA